MQNKNVTQFNNHTPYYICHTTNQRGFTLIEILIAVSIFVMVAGMVVGIFITNSRIQAKTQSTRELSQILRYSIEAIGREVQLADGCITSNGDPASPEDYFANPPIISDGTTLTLARTDKNNQNACVIHKYSLTTDGRIEVIVSTNGTPASAIYFNDLSSVKINSFLITPSDVFTDLFYTDRSGAYPIPKAITQQPSIQLTLQGQYASGKKASEASTQTLRTAFTTRNYPGFNDVSR